MFCINALIRTQKHQTHSTFRMDL